MAIDKKPMVSPERLKQLREQYDKSPMKEKMSFKEFVKDRALSDTNFVPWLYNFEQHEDFNNGLTFIQHDAFDAWVDEFDNY